jgi:hypothetical protein
MFRRQLRIPFPTVTKKPLSSTSILCFRSNPSSCSVGCCLIQNVRFCSAATTTTAKPTAATEGQKILVDESSEQFQELEEARIDRFVEDMYSMPVFNPLVILLTSIGVAGFLITWGYFVATPVYLAHVGKSSEDSGKGADASELD